MIRLGISVEGQTENEFVTSVLAPHLLALDIFAATTIVQTRRAHDGTRFVGGAVSLDRVARQIRPLLHSFDYVTTLYDFYGFRGRAEGENVEALQQRLAEMLRHERFIPYIQKYEFENLLFGGDGVLPPTMESPQLSAAIREVVMQSGDPELINDTRETAPSRRLDRLFLTHLRIHYDKTGHGPVWAGRIGLERLRLACPRFGRWLERLENLPPA